MTKKLSLIAILIVSAAVPAPAADGPSSRPSRETMQRIGQLVKGLGQLIQDENWDQALKDCQELATLAPKDPVAHIYMAGVQANMEKPDDAVTSLQKAVELGFSHEIYLLTSPPLVPLHEDKRFADILAQAKKNADKMDRAKMGVRMRQGRISAFCKQIDKLVKEEKYEPAAKLCQRLTQLEPEHSIGYYNLAGALARQEKLDDAFKNLAQAAELGFAMVDHFQKDENLKAMRDDPRMAPIAEKIGKNDLKLMQTLYEPGIPLKDVKTVEGLADKGFRYRVRMSPQATKDKPNRLLVWMHGRGGSGNAYIEPSAPIFIEKGYALLVFPHKSWMKWNQKKLLATIQAVGEIEGIDAEKPALICFSLGGQTAIRMWKSKPDRFSAMILNAAYPINRKANKEGKILVEKPPTKPGAKDVRIYGLVGDRDAGKEVWKQAETVYPAAGIDVTTRYIPGAGHTFLISPDEAKRIAEWLVAPRSVPSAPETQPETKPAD